MTKFNVGDYVYVIIGSYHIESGKLIYERNIEKFLVTNVCNYKTPQYEVKNNKSLCFLPEIKLNATYRDAETKLKTPSLPLELSSKI